MQSLYSPSEFRVTFKPAFNAQKGLNSALLCKSRNAERNCLFPSAEVMWLMVLMWLLNLRLKIPVTWPCTAVRREGRLPLTVWSTFPSQIQRKPGSSSKDHLRQAYMLLHSCPKAASQGSRPWFISQSAGTRSTFPHQLVFSFRAHDCEWIFPQCWLFRTCLNKG